ncbi:hypothetical protein C8R45DRAFT_842854 [Mycena sanguinolenta]|nr:hypothetical protein C8R45DRAFT_842854 [Mycena sanguinolenta]
MDDAEDDEEGEEGTSSEGKKHVCPNCSKRFNRPSSLRIHLNTHTGATPFRCPHPSCGRAFNVNSNMRRHFRNHGPSVFTSKPALSADNSTTPSPSATAEIDSKSPIVPASSNYRSAPAPMSPSPFYRSTSSPITPTSPSAKFPPAVVPTPFQRCPAQWGIVQSSIWSDDKLHLDRGETELPPRSYSESGVRSER